MGAAAAVVGHWEWGPVPNGGGVFFWYRPCVYPGRKEGTIALTHERGIRGGGDPRRPRVLAHSTATFGEDEVDSVCQREVQVPVEVCAC